MKSHGKAMRLVTDLLDKVQDWGESVQYDGLALLSRDIDPLFTLGNGGDRLIDNTDTFERVLSRVQLSNSAVNQNQARKPRSLFLKTRIATCDHFPHGSKIVITDNGADHELPV